MSPISHEQNPEYSQRGFLRDIINKRAIASYMPESFKDIVLDIAIDMKKVKTMDDVFARAQAYDTMLGDEDQHYENIIRSSYQHHTDRYGSSEKAQAATLKSLKERVTLDTAKAKLLKETKEKGLDIRYHVLIDSANLCVTLTKRHIYNVIPNPKYL